MFSVTLGAALLYPKIEAFTSGDLNAIAELDAVFATQKYIRPSWKPYRTVVHKNGRGQAYSDDSSVLRTTSVNLLDGASLSPLANNRD